MAKNVGLHIRTLERCFEQQFRIAPKKWIMQQRLARGFTLLQQGLSNKEIAAELGYSQESNFCRDFKRAYGSAPQELARRTASTPKPTNAARP